MADIGDISAVWPGIGLEFQTELGNCNPIIFLQAILSVSMFSPARPIGRSSCDEVTRYVKNLTYNARSNHDANPSFCS